MNSIPVLLLTAAMLYVPWAQAQDIHYTQIDAMPMAVNPAYTGMTNHKARIAFIQRSELNPDDYPYHSYDFSIDKPLLFKRHMSYAAVGGQATRVNSGYGGLAHTTAFLSGAYHLLLGGDSASSRFSISAGAQYGLRRGNFCPGDIYFDHHFYFPYAVIAITRPVLKSRFANAGLAFSAKATPHINLTAGVSVTNVAGKNSASLEQTNDWNGQDRHLTASAGANIMLSPKFTLRPTGVFIHHATFNEYMGGTDCIWNIKKKTDTRSFITAIFLGGWYRSSFATSMTAGVEFNRLQFGISTDAVAYPAGNDPAFELMVRYQAIASKSSKRKAIPCDRF